MGLLSEISTTILQTLASLYLLIIVLRFLLQIAKADFYNPVSQFIVKATNPLLIPLRRIIPGLFGLEIPCIVLALVLQWLVIQALGFLSIGSLLPALPVLIWSIIGLASLVLNIYFWGLLIMVIISWVAPGNPNPMLTLLNSLINPALKPIQRIIPPLGGLDLTPIFAFLLIHILRLVVNHMAQAAGLPPQLVLGI